MNKEFYNKETIDSFQESIESKLNSILEVQHEMHAEVKKTNGRVQSLERWKAYITGAVAVILALVLPVFMQAVKVSFE